MQTETNVTKTKDVLVFAESAANKVKTLIEDEKNPNLNLRVFITGGGCSGCLLYTSPSPRDGLLSRMPSSA